MGGGKTLHLWYSRPMTSVGILYITATPIGNLADISGRLTETLASVDLIAAEDTRHTRKLLSHLGLSKPLVSCHEHNEARIAQMLITRLLGGESVALVTDAGTPAISDPGAIVVSEAVKAGIRVSPIPGPSSLICALSVSGFSLDHGFIFEGFLPHKPAAREKRWIDLRNEPRVIVLLESTHRINRLISEMSRFIPSRSVVIGRELTKLHETIVRGTPEHLSESISRTGTKGEFTVVIDMLHRVRDDHATAPEPDHNVVLRRLAKGDSVRTIAAELSESTGMPQRLIYRKILEIKNNNSNADT